MKKLLILALMPLFLFACGQRTTTTTVTTNPRTGQQTTTTTTVDDNVNNQSYQVYSGPGGQQYAVTYINGQQMYVPYNIFQQQMAIGGYGALNDYYYSNGSYFHPYSTGSFAAGFVLATALSGSYNNYYSRNNITSYRSYHYQHPPMARAAVSGTNNVRQPITSQGSVSGMGQRPGYVQQQRPQPSTSGMGQRPMQQTQTYRPAAQSSGMGSRSSSSSGSRSGMGGRSGRR